MVVWDTVMIGSVNECWEKLKLLLTDMQERFIPLVENTLGRKKAIWMTYKAVECIRRKRQVCRKYKDSKYPACVRALKRVNEEVRKAKCNFEK